MNLPVRIGMWLYVQSEVSDGPFGLFVPRCEVLGPCLYSLGFVLSWIVASMDALHQHRPVEGSWHDRQASIGTSLLS